MAPALRHVSLPEIDLQDRTFVATYRPDIHVLQQSIAQVGVLTPVHLRQSSAKAPLQIVAGWKRCIACQDTGQAHVPALVYHTTELSDQQACLLALHDNLGCRTFNAIEKARLLHCLQQQGHYTPTTVLHEFCPLLGLPPRPETLTTYSTLLTVDDALQAAVAEGVLPLETVLWMTAYPVQDQAALCDLFTGLKVGVNRARECATAIDEICRRDACSPTALLHRLGVSAMLAAEQLSGPQKIEQLRRVLHQARYPRLSAHEARFHDAVRRLRLPPPISLRPTPYFEGPYQITLSFRQRQELQHYAQRLLDAADHEALKVLLDLL
jgi:ParB/RepB/Spo0J family partition protein